MIEIIGGTWAAGETKTFHINGKRFEILDAQYPCDVMLMDKAGSQLSVMRNSEASFFSEPDEGFSTVQVYSAQAQLIRFFVGSGDAGTRRISSTVQVVDGGKARTLANAAMGGGAYQPLLASNFAQIQLWNPAASGRRLILKAYTVGSATGQFVKGNFYGTALTNLAMVGISKQSGGGAGVGECRRQNSLTDVVGANTYTDVASVVANSAFPRVLQEPLIINPGAGFVLMGASVGADLSGAFEWTEEVI